jgi:hopanoid biosynthesis associated radical SAM protein HpnH
MMISPGYSYEKAPNQSNFLARENARELYRQILSNRSKKWRFNQSPLFLEFLMGKRDYECTPWGIPTYNLFGWQKPCYLLQDGYADTFQELMEETKWANYGHGSGNPKCQNCMVQSGFEPTAVNDTFSSLGGMIATAKAMVSQYKDPSAMESLENNKIIPAYKRNPLVQITPQESTR